MQYIKLKSRSPFEYIYRFISSFLVRNWLSHKKITPNQITLLRIPILVVGLIGFFVSGAIGVSIGILAIILWDLFDVLDGDLAEFTHQKTPLGGFLEEILDFTFGKLAGPLGFVLVLACVGETKEYHYWIFFFILLWADNFFARFMKAKNDYFQLDGKKLKENMGNGRYSFLKIVSDNLLYYELQVTIVSVALLYSSIGIKAYIFPIALYSTLYLLASAIAVLIVLLSRPWKQ